MGKGILDSEALTEREADVLACLAEGLSNSEIAARLFLSPSTVKWYVRQLNSKLNATNREEILQQARAAGLLGAEQAEYVAPKHNLPHQTTPFIGRESELEELARLLVAPDVRLVTILAPGGMGKTRLALEAGEQQLDHFPNGVYFIPLQALNEVAQIIPAVAQGVGFQFTEDTRPPRQQLLDYLGGKHMLLILDNWEHLLDGAPLISELLQAAPGLKVLATSREKLRLSGETVYHLPGMQFPTWETPEDALGYDAVKLLIQAAQWVRPDFAVTKANLDIVARVCRLTEGMPLGILLATGWLDVLSLERIAEEIQKNVDFLETEIRDVPERQRSIRAIFESAWERLTPDDQQAFMKLTVFRGGCTPEAAEALTGAKPRTLQTLVNKALVLRTKEGRYDIHFLLRQYGYARLEASGTLRDVLRQHGAYFADFLCQREDDLKGRRQLEAIEEIEAEFDNLRQVWHYAVHHQDMGLIEQIAWSVMTYVTFRSRQFEFIPFFGEAVQVLEAKYGEQASYGRLLSYYARMLTNFGRHAEAEPAMRKALAIAQAQNDQAGIAYSSRELVRTIFDLGKREEAEQLIEISIRIHEAMQDDFERAEDLFVKGYVRAVARKSEEALTLARQALEIQQRLGNAIGTASALNNIAAELGNTGHFEEGEALSREAFALRKKLRQPVGIANSLCEMAYWELIKGEVEAAETYAQQALEMAEAIANPLLKAKFMFMLMHIDLASDRFAEAEQKAEETMPLVPDHYQSACFAGKGMARLGVWDWEGGKKALVEFLRLDQHHPPEMNLMEIAAFGFIKAHEGQNERGVEIASAALNSILMEKAFTNSGFVGRHLEAIRARLTDKAYAKAWERGKTLDVKSVFADLVAEYVTNQN